MNSLLRPPVLAATCTAALAAGCIGMPLPTGYLGRARPEPLAAPVQERQREFYRNDPSLPARETSVLILEDRSKVKHGREFEWYEDGQVRSEREFRNGEPVGTWRTYFPDGSPESLVSFGEPGEPGESARAGEMIWWHADGRVSSQGPLRGGVREGDWVEYHENGQKRAEGRYYGNRRTGTWTYWHADGSLAERGNYGAGGVRVGAWERWRPGENAGEVAIADDDARADPSDGARPDDPR